MKKQKLFSISLACVIPLALASCADNSASGPENTACNYCRTVEGSWYTSLDGNAHKIDLLGYSSYIFLLNEISWAPNGWTAIGRELRMGFYTRKASDTFALEVLTQEYGSKVFDGIVTHAGNTFYYVDDTGLNLTFHCLCFFR